MATARFSVAGLHRTAERPEDWRAGLGSRLGRPMGRPGSSSQTLCGTMQTTLDATERSALITRVGDAWLGRTGCTHKLADEAMILRERKLGRQLTDNGLPNTFQKIKFAKKI